MEVLDVDPLDTPASALELMIYRYVNDSSPASIFYDVDSMVRALGANKNSKVKAMPLLATFLGDLMPKASLVNNPSSDPVVWKSKAMWPFRVPK